MANTDTTIGRLLKKIAKLQKQRDFFRERCDHYAAVMRLHPSAESRYEFSRERNAERARLRELERRVKEQELLIERLRAPASS